MALLIYPNGKQQVVFAANKVFTLQEMYNLIKCRTIDIIPLHDGKSMIVDEEFACRDDWEENINIRATVLYKKGRSTSREKKEFLEQKKKEGWAIIEVTEDNDSDSIAGTVLVCDPGEMH